MVKWY